MAPHFPGQSGWDLAIVGLPEVCWDEPPPGDSPASPSQTTVQTGLSHV